MVSSAALAQHHPDTASILGSLLYHLRVSPAASVGDTDSDRELFYAPQAFHYLTISIAICPFCSSTALRVDDRASVAAGNPTPASNPVRAARPS